MLMAREAAADQAWHTIPASSRAQEPARGEKAGSSHLLPDYWPVCVQAFPVMTASINQVVQW